MTETPETWEIRPFQGVGPVRFGMSRAEVRAILGDDFTTFRKGLAAEDELTDGYDSIGGHFYYDAQDKLEFVELFEPCLVQYGELPLLGRLVADVLAGAPRLALQARREDDAVFFYAAGFGLVVHEEVVDGVSVFQRGYYDDPK